MLMAQGSAEVHKDCVPACDTLPLYINNNKNNTNGYMASCLHLGNSIVTPDTSALSLG